MHGRQPPCELRESTVHALQCPAINYLALIALILHHVAKCNIACSEQRTLGHVEVKDIFW